MSDTRLYQMAKGGAADGRPLAVVTCCDFDPAGRQMPVSIGRRLQGLRDLCFPDLKFEVVPVALTLEQVRALGLPSTPLKPTELRADKWRQAFGHEQTEIDALATLQPDLLRQIVEESLALYFDTTLADRVERAKAEWTRRALRVIAERVDRGALADIKAEVADLEVDVTERLEAIKEEAEERIAAADSRLDDLIEDIELPQPELPEARLPEKLGHAVLVSSEWSFAKASQALKEQKNYGREGA